MRAFVVVALAWLCLGGCARRIAVCPTVEPPGPVAALGDAAVPKNLHAPTRDWLFVLGVEDSRWDVLERAGSILRANGISPAVNGSLWIAVTVQNRDAERAAHVLREDPLTRPHVHELTEDCGRAGFYVAQRAWLRLVREPRTEKLMRLVERIDELLTPAKVCKEWSWASDALILEVLPHEEARVRTMLKADPLVAPYLKD